MKCDDVQKRLELYVLEALDPDESVLINRHLSGCRSCQTAASQYRLICETIDREFADQQDAVVLAHRVMNHSSRRIRAIKRMRPAFRLTSTILSLAACAAVVVGLSLMFWRSPTHVCGKPAVMPQSAAVMLKTRSPQTHPLPFGIPVSDNSQIVNGRYLITVVGHDTGYAATCIDIQNQRAEWQSSPGCLGYFTRDGQCLYYLRRSEANQLCLVAADIQTGRTLWQCDTDTELTTGVLTCPSIVGPDRLCWVYGNAVSMIHKETGRRIWQQSVSGETILSAAKNTPGAIVVAGNSALYRFDPESGRSAVEYPYPCPSCQTRPALLEVIDGHYYIALSLRDGTSRVMCVDSVNRQIRWDKQAPRVTQLCQVEDHLFLRCQSVYAIDKQTGVPKWHYQAKGCSPIESYDNMIVFVNQGDHGKLTALETETGSKVWQLDGFHSCNAFIQAGSKGYLKTTDGVLHVISFG